MGCELFLEQFDLPNLQPPIPAASADWLAGHAAGLSDGLAQADIRQASLRDDVAQAIVEIAFTYAEARTQILSALVPLFTVMMERLLPQIAQSSLVPQLVDRLIAAARADSQCPMRIAVHPDALVAVADCLPSTLPLPLDVKSDPMLGPGQAVLLHRGAETVLDLDGLVRGLQLTLAALFDETERRTDHG